jgi:hypothetical protein
VGGTATPSTWSSQVSSSSPGDGTGQFGFIAVRGWLDCRAVEREGRVGVEFTWEGVDEGDQVSGRGWASLVDDATVEGHLFFHLGDDSSFRAEPFSRAAFFPRR